MYLSLSLAADNTINASSVSITEVIPLMNEDSHCHAELFAAMLALNEQKI